MVRFIDMHLRLIARRDLGPYDAIHVGAAAPTLPVKLVEQLASPGRMFIPVGTFAQHILHVDKDVNGKVTETRIMDVRVSHGVMIMNCCSINCGVVCSVDRSRVPEMIIILDSRIASSF